MGKQNNAYIRMYTDGSAARRLEVVEPIRKVQPSSLPKKKHVSLVRLDPYAIFGIAVAFIMTVLMVIGSFQLHSWHVKENDLQKQVLQLQREQQRIQDVYDSACNLVRIEQMAVAMGLVPEESVAHVMVEP